MDKTWPSTHTPDIMLISMIRDGDVRSWELLISKYEGRLHAFAMRKLSDFTAVDDVVQETFLGFHLSLPHFDSARSIESYLFTICSHKIIDHMRRIRKRLVADPTDILRRSGSVAHLAEENLPDRQRMVSSIYRSQERKSAEERVFVDLLEADVKKWKTNQDWVKLACIELLFATANSNKSISETLGLSEQKVANYKSDYLIRIKNQIAKL